MTSVLHLRKLLKPPPVVASVPEISFRHMVVPEDVPGWLALHRRATAGLTPAVRPWTRDDFQTEMAGKPWWGDERTWLALAGEPRSPENREIIGAVTLAERAGTTGSIPVVHWLLVDPACRRRGIGRLLMAHLEQAAWDAGWREIHLETHAGWTEAVAFYRAIGCLPVTQATS